MKQVWICIQLVCIYTVIRADVVSISDYFVDQNITVNKIVLVNEHQVCLITSFHANLFIVNNFTNETIIAEYLPEPESIEGNCTTNIFRQLTVMTKGIKNSIGEKKGDWLLTLEWEREPDSYEFGEVGWSSVGSPANTTSGTYGLTTIRARVPLSWFRAGSSQPGIEESVELINRQEDRFKTRSGDHYVCDAKIEFLLYFVNSSSVTNSSQIKMHLEFQVFKMQSFSDVNVSEYTGTGQMCYYDLPSDSGISVGIGVAVSVLVVAVLAFLAIGRLKEKDQQYKEVDSNKWLSQHART